MDLLTLFLVVGLWVLLTLYVVRWVGLVNQTREVSTFNYKVAEKIGMHFHGMPSWRVKKNYCLWFLFDPMNQELTFSYLEQEISSGMRKRQEDYLNLNWRALKRRHWHGFFVITATKFPLFSNVSSKWRMLTTHVFHVMTYQALISICGKKQYD